MNSLIEHHLANGGSVGAAYTTMMGMTSSTSPPHASGSSDGSGGTGESKFEQKASEPDTDTIKMFVGQVPRHWSEKECRDLFEEYGPVYQLNVLRDRTTQMSRGCCFVTYYHRKDAIGAQSAMHNVRILDGMHHAVQMKPADMENRNDRKIFIGMLNKKMNENDIKTMFTKFGAIEDCMVLRDNDGKSRGCAFITYSSRAQAQNAIRFMHQAHTMEGCNLPIVVKFADTQRKSAETDATQLTPGTQNGVTPLPASMMPMQTQQGLLESGLQGFANPYWLAMQGAAAVSPPAPAAAAANTSALNSLALMQQLAAINPQYLLQQAQALQRQQQQAAAVAAMATLSPQQQQLMAIQQLLQGNTAGLQFNGATTGSALSPATADMSAMNVYNASMAQQQNTAAAAYQARYATGQAAVSQTGRHYLGASCTNPPQSSSSCVAGGGASSDLLNTLLNTVCSLLQQQIHTKTIDAHGLPKDPQSCGDLDSTDEIEREALQQLHECTTTTEQSLPNHATLIAQQQAALNAQQQQHSTQLMQNAWAGLQQYNAALTNQQAPTTYTLSASPNSAQQSAAAGQREGPIGSNLFIYHLPQEFTDTELASTFAPFGTIVSAKVFVDKVTNLSKCFGFVSYDNAASAMTAINAMNGFQIGTKRLKVQLKKSKDESKPYAQVTTNSISV